MPDLRQRSGRGHSSSRKKTGAELEDDDELDYSSPSTSTGFISILDVFRVILLLLVASSALSYYVTSDSLLWGYKPRFMRWGVLKSYIRGPIKLNPEQLSLYNGTDLSLPIYVAVNRTIFDVSANPRIYGKGGGYNSLAGVDATRAYVTGCFEEDRTADIRGVELMFTPIEDDDESPVEMGMSKAQKKIRREREMREARERVWKQVKHWQDFFANHKDYFEVGQVVGIDVMMEGPERELCESAQKRRPKRSSLNNEVK
ncbi:hypothetical protein ACJ72_05129 [Emergomyces africanus]|uniref:Cytochrome b5 heme-binding domain-containing protein n=1 Tax=Emergomyces africanus TaxID=1955775 RepID=A0A1B7NUV2_9EURO|nr:hypothetical protein ACJ72_05129 [Emergomyces africanus]